MSELEEEILPSTNSQAHAGKSPFILSAIGVVQKGRKNPSDMILLGLPSGLLLDFAICLKP